MPSIVVDAGPLVALLRRSDRHHLEANEFVARHRKDALATNLIVVGEVAAVLEQRHVKLVKCLEWIQDHIEVDPAIEDMPRALEVVERYDDLPADLADASLVAMAERRGTDRVASIDSDFEVYRMSRNRRLRNVFLPTS